MERKRKTWKRNGKVIVGFDTTCKRTDVLLVIQCKKEEEMRMKKEEWRETFINYDDSRSHGLQVHK
jgi:hypothetical protein